jgi:hypothetical protein
MHFVCCVVEYTSPNLVQSTDLYRNLNGIESNYRIRHLTHSEASGLSLYAGCIGEPDSRLEDGVRIDLKKEGLSMWIRCDWFMMGSNGVLL